MMANIKATIHTKRYMDFNLFNWRIGIYRAWIGTKYKWFILFLKLPWNKKVWIKSIPSIHKK